MTFEEWLKTVPDDFTSDPLWKMKVYRLSLFLCDVAWRDVSKLNSDSRTRRIGGQLYRSIGSINANIAEGYGRRSGRDRARLYEYVLGSARESRTWYYQGKHVLSDHVAAHRLGILSDITRMLTTIIRETRPNTLSETKAVYESLNKNL